VRERERERTHTVARIFGDEHVYPESVTEPVPSLIQYAEILTWQGETRIKVDIFRRVPCPLQDCELLGRACKQKCDTVCMAVYD
jgi:hypothetical protein